MSWILCEGPGKSLWCIQPMGKCIQTRKHKQGNTKKSESEMRRGPRNSSIPVPRFQSGGGLLNHTGGPYSHSGMMDYPRFQISEMHLGKLPDSMEFQSWKVNFKTEVCSKSGDPHLTMQWIREVEIAKSIDDLMTPQLITVRTDFPDNGMIDAMIASALKKIITSVHFRKESKCRRTACSKVRQILTRKGDCLHVLRILLGHRSL